VRYCIKNSQLSFASNSFYVDLEPNLTAKVAVVDKHKHTSDYAMLYRVASNADVLGLTFQKGLSYQITLISKHVLSDDDIVISTDEQNQLLSRDETFNLCAFAAPSSPTFSSSPMSCQSLSPWSSDSEQNDVSIGPGWLP
jgi:hypothetical protein